MSCLDPRFLSVFILQTEILCNFLISFIFSLCLRCTKYVCAAMSSSKILLFTHVCLCHCRLQLSVSLMKCNVILCPSCSSGSLIQLPSVERGKLSKVRLGSLSLKKEGERQCFLFTKHFLVCTRSSGGKLHLLKVRTPQPQ